jgi:hypothetical protein
MSPEPTARTLSFAVGDVPVSGLLLAPASPRHLYVLAHGAGAGMRHPFLEAMAGLLVPLGIATLRYQFPYMEKRSKRPDPPKVAHAAVRAAVDLAAREVPGVPLLAGGKSFGGRMTSQAQAEAPLPGVRGLVFLGFPLHPPGKPGIERAEHLARVEIPMLFLQGTRDDFARLDLITEVAAHSAPRATLELVDGADHSFGVRKASGRSPADVMEGLASTVAEWADRET